jgi:eukaryotic-like serine/threonine-protein kinase
MALQPDEVLENKYRIVRLLGEGGMGAVYEGHNTRIQRRVAIKVLHGGAGSSASAVERFEREAQAAGRIGSKHIVQVLDLGDLPGGERYMVMEYLDGVDLTRRIRSLGKMRPRELYPIAVQILEGLVAAHDAGIIHRDLKPDNIFIVPEGEYADFVKILDFGISKFQNGGEFSMTQTGVVMGTPYYMSPEQAKGSKDIDGRTDLYSLGVILYEALSGQVPFSAETFNALILKIVLEDPRPLAEPRDDEERAFHAIVRKAMARPLDVRYQTAAEFQGDLHDWARTFEVPLSTIVKRRSNFPPGTTHMHGTQRAWTQTNSRLVGTTATEPAPAEPLPTHSTRALKVGAGVLVLGIGVATWFLTRGASSPQAATPPEGPAVPSAGVPTPASEPAKAPVAPAPSPTPSSESTAAASTNAHQAPAESPKQEAAGSDAKVPPRAVASGKARVTSTPPAPPAESAAAKPAAPKPPTPKSTTSSGRTIRTEL